MKVPFLSLNEQYKRIKDEVWDGLKRVVESQHFILGEEVKAFEKEFANYLGAKYAVGVASGTDALVLSLRALGIKQDDEVITTDYSFFASASCVALVSAKPVLADIEKDGFNIDPNEIEKKLTKKTKAIIPVHLFGKPAQMEPILELAKKRGIFVVEDACQAIGSEYKGKKVGTIGHCGCFSFYPSKVLGCYGDGGMITTNSKEVYNRLLELRVHGAQKDKLRNVFGTNSRLDAIQCAILRAKLKHIEQWIKERRKKAEIYNNALSKVVKVPEEKKDERNTFSSYVIRTKKRDELSKYLEKNGIGYAIYYSYPFHKMRCFSEFISKKENFPNAEKRAKEAIALPIYPELKKTQQYQVIKTVLEFFQR